jgi:hypothetical protein
MTPQEILEPYVLTGKVYYIVPPILPEHPFVALVGELEGYNVHQDVLDEVLKKLKQATCSTGFMRYTY